jgi:cytochrome P450
MQDDVGEPEFSFPAPRRCPFEAPAEYEIARERGVVRAKLWDGQPTWFVGRYKDVSSILMDRRFSSNVKEPNFPFFSESRAKVLLAKPFGLPFIDPPEHSKLRRIFAPMFTVRNMELFKPQLDAFVRTVISDLVEKGPPADLCKDFSQRITVWSIVELMGLPHEDEHFFHECSQGNLFQTIDAAAGLRANEQMEIYLDQFLAQKEQNPVEADDIITRLVIDHIIPGNLTREQATHLLVNLVLNGQDSTANMITLGALAMMAHPEQLEQLKQDPDLVSNAIDEMLRYFSIALPVAPRVALEDLEVGGQAIRKGDGVVASIVSANRDATVFADPESFDIRREGVSRHLGFGQGVHSCIGRPVALLELEAVFTTLFQSIPGLRLAVPIEEIEGTGETAQAYGVRSLPVTW